MSQNSEAPNLVIFLSVSKEVDLKSAPSNNNKTSHPSILGLAGVDGRIAADDAGPIHGIQQLQRSVPPASDRSSLARSSNPTSFRNSHEPRETDQGSCPRSGSWEETALFLAT